MTRLENDLKKSMQLAGQNLLNCLNPEKNFTPYWEMVITPEGKARYSDWWPQHNLGRWWDAMLRLEDCTGFVIPAREEGAMLQNLFRFFQNPDGLCFQPLDYNGQLFPIDLHSLRESLLALHALARFRNSRWAREAGRRMLETVARLWRNDGMWDLSQLEFYKGTQFQNSDTIYDPTGTSGRLVEALVWFYEATQDSLALELARRLAEWHYENSTLPDGSICFAHPVSHTHSFLGTLRGLFLYGRLTNQARFLQRVRACYEKTVRVMAKESGYTSHDIGREDRGETTSAGDAAQLAMWLAEAGYEEYWDDAQRLVRARILPSQITEPLPLAPMEEGGGDCFRALGQRAVGGFGGMHTHPHGGKMNTTDITAADLHTLTDVYRHIVTRCGDGLHVNFQFDYEGEGIAVRVTRSRSLRMQVSCTGDSPLLIRVPQWAGRDGVSLTVQGAAAPLRWQGSFLAVEGRPGGQTAEVCFPLPEKIVQEVTAGTCYTLRFLGDEVTGISPNAPYLPFYPDL